MYPGKYAVAHPDRAAFVMASSGESVSYAEFEARANRLTHLLQNEGLSRQDHYSIMMENNNRYLEACAAGERAGLYYTCINSYLTVDELAYILDNSESQILITSMSKLEVATDAVAQSSKVRKVLVVDADANKLPDGFEDYATACQSFPATPIDNERLGTSMLYSSGTTGRPKGIIRPLPEQPPAQALPMYDFLGQLWHYREDMIYLSPAPLYHSAPQAAVNLTIRQGGTVIIMERFDSE
ncbi:MAG: AMP-binding protein, partial [Pseudomonadota bacterium]|nr:AMP-binding protein [Pseudomonadota bacterium]